MLPLEPRERFSIVGKETMQPRQSIAVKVRAARSKSEPADLSPEEAVDVAAMIDELGKLESKAVKHEVATLWRVVNDPTTPEDKRIVREAILEKMVDLDYKLGGLLAQ